MTLDEGLDGKRLNLAVVEQLHDDLLEWADFEVEAVENKARLGKDGSVSGDFSKGGTEFVFPFYEEIGNVVLNAGFETLQLVGGGDCGLAQLGYSLGELGGGGSELGSSFIKSTDAAGHSFHSGGIVGLIGRLLATIL